MRVLGAVMAGGQSRRFGSDKAVALLDGKTLLDHVVERLAPQVDAVVVCGRQHLRLASLGDRPGGGLGPLAGLNAALHHARTSGFDAVLSVACDVPALPVSLRTLLGDAPAYLAELPVIGIWPADLADRLDAHLRDCDDRSLRRWARETGAAPRQADHPIANINTAADLAEITRPTMPARSDR